MRARLAGALVLLLVGLVAVGSPPARSQTQDLELQLERALVAPGIAAARTAALAVDLRTGDVVFERNAESPLAPASAVKLAVAYAALKVLGPRFRFQTSLHGAGEQVGRAWRGDLYLVGYGDPTLALADLDALAGELTARGIRHVEGDVLGDESHFDRVRTAPGWRPTYLGLESAPLSALSVGGARPEGANGSAATAAGALVTALARRGVRVWGRASTGTAPLDADELARDVSEPMAAIVRRMNTDSDNFVSEMVLKELGATLGGAGSTSGGARVVRGALARAGVPLRGVRIADGSGLSAIDRLTAEALVAILRSEPERREVLTVLVRSLAVAGRTGTLERRLVRPPTRGAVRAKTGTTRRASALAGYVGGRYAFAILQNGSPVPSASARAAQDRFVTVLARFA